MLSGLASGQIRTIDRLSWFSLASKATWLPSAQGAVMPLSSNSEPMAAWTTLNRSNAACATTPSIARGSPPVQLRPGEQPALSASLARFGADVDCSDSTDYFAAMPAKRRKKAKKRTNGSSPKPKRGAAAVRDYEVITLRIKSRDKVRLLAHCQHRTKIGERQISYNQAIIDLIQNAPA